MYDVYLGMTGLSKLNGPSGHIILTFEVPVPFGPLDTRPSRCEVEHIHRTYVGMLRIFLFLFEVQEVSLFSLELLMHISDYCNLVNLSQTFFR